MSLQQAASTTIGFLLIMGQVLLYLYFLVSMLMKSKPWHYYRFWKLTGKFPPDRYSVRFYDWQTTIVPTILQTLAHELEAATGKERQRAWYRFDRAARTFTFFGFPVGNRDSYLKDSLEDVNAHVQDILHKRTQLKTTRYRLGDWG